MSYDDKINSATALIEEHNSKLEDINDAVDVKEFKKKLKKLGGTSEEALKDATFEDIEVAGVPRILARKIATIFRLSEKQQTNFVSDKKAQQMHPLYLLQAYSANDPNSPVAKRLKELSRGQKFIVFSPGTSNVVVDASVKLLEEIMKGYPERTEYELDGKFVRTYPVGEGILTFADENPLYPNRPLRPDGTCDQTNRSWNGVPLYVRQLIYLAVGKNGVTFDKAHNILDIVTGPDAEKKLIARYPKVAVELDEALASSTQPLLRIKLDNSSKKSNNPFLKSVHETF
jgi:hypothetical protein